GHCLRFAAGAAFVAVVTVGPDVSVVVVGVAAPFHRIQPGFNWFWDFAFFRAQNVVQPGIDNRGLVGG
nr:hypothetical protein [Corynebacterium belfantii]